MYYILLLFVYLHILTLSRYHDPDIQNEEEIWS